MKKYSPLTAWLSSVTSSLVSVPFARIEEVINDKLPASARTYRSWWGNEGGARSRQCSSWLEADWEVESVDLIRERVVFTRTVRYPFDATFNADAASNF